jgi:hypothetical protein
MNIKKYKQNKSNIMNTKNKIVEIFGKNSKYNLALSIRMAPCAPRHDAESAGIEIVFADNKKDGLLIIQQKKEFHTEKGNTLTSIGGHVKIGDEWLSFVGYAKGDLRTDNDKSTKVEILIVKF